MKGFIDENGYDRPACVTCKYKNNTNLEWPCDRCIPIIDLTQHKPICETNFVCYEPMEQEEHHE